MPAIQSLGIGSGLDANSIITQLLSIERQPLVRLQNQGKEVQAQISAWGTLKAKVDALGAAADTLATPGTWMETAVTVSEPEALAVTASATAEPVDLDVAVTALAQRQSISTQAFIDSTSSVGTGTLSIQLGTWSANFGGFSPNPALASVPVTITPGSDSLADIRDAINAADAGVTASILNDASGSRLVIRSSATGEAQGFSITVSGATGSLDALSFTAQTSPAAATGAQGNQQAANLEATINGAHVSSASNTMTDVLDGITIQALKPTTGSSLVSIQRDRDGMKDDVKSFVSAYNELMTFIRQQTSYNATTKTAATLQGDRAAITVQNQIRNDVIAGSGASAVYERLSAIGIELQSDGSLKARDSRLDEALQTDLDEVASLFSRDDAAAANDGVARRLSDLVDRLLDTDGTLTTRTQGLSARLSRNQDEQGRLEDRLAQVEARMRAQYTALDRQMASLTGLNQYVAQQMQMISNASSKG